MVDYKKWSTIVDSDDEDEATPPSRPTAAAGGGRPETLDDLSRRMPPTLYRKLTEAQLAATSGTQQEAERCAPLPRSARAREHACSRRRPAQWLAALTPR